MDKKEMLIKLFELKDRKRRRLLMDLFHDTIIMDISIRFICQIINEELGRPEMIAPKDVVYCRFHFSKKGPSRTTIAPPDISKPEISSKPLPTEDDNKVLWSDPDDNNYKKQSSIKSKYSQ